MNATVTQQDERLVRISDIIGSKNTLPLVSISRANLWKKILEEKFPQPIKVLGPKTTCFKYSDIQEYIACIVSGRPLPLSCKKPDEPNEKAISPVKKKSGKRK